MILHPPIVQNVAANLIPPGNLTLLPYYFSQLLIALGLLEELELALEDAHGQALVLLLRALDRAGDGDAGWLMCNAHGAGHLIDILPAGAGCADERDEVQIGFGDLRLRVGFVKLRRHVEGCEARLALA